MIARYPGRCVYCGRDITVGVDQYDYDKKESYHNECPFGDAKPSEEQLALADRLGFRPYRDLFPLPAAPDGGTGRDEREA